MKIKIILLSYFSAQFLKFFVCGSTSAFINWSLRIILSDLLSINTWLSYTIAYFSGLTAAFFLYKKFVFPYSSLSINTQAMRFIGINFIFFPLTFLGFVFFKDIFLELGLGYVSGPLSHTIVLALPPIITFILYKFFAFKEGNTVQKNAF